MLNDVVRQLLFEHIAGRTSPQAAEQYMHQTGGNSLGPHAAIGFALFIDGTTVRVYDSTPDGHQAYIGDISNQQLINGHVESGTTRASDGSICYFLITENKQD